MQKLHKNDTFMYENKLLDDFEDYDTVPRQSHTDEQFVDPLVNRITWQTSQSVSSNTVHKPTHYGSGDIECIDAIKASMSAEAFKGYLKGNTQKYVWRYSYKNGLEDLEKAKVYLEWLIKEEKSNEL